MVTVTVNSLAAGLLSLVSERLRAQETPHVVLDQSYFVPLSNGSLDFSVSAGSCATTLREDGLFVSGAAEAIRPKEKVANDYATALGHLSVMSRRGDIRIPFEISNPAPDQRMVIRQVGWKVVRHEPFSVSDTCVLLRGTEALPKGVFESSFDVGVFDVSPSGVKPPMRGLREDMLQMGIVPLELEPQQSIQIMSSINVTVSGEYQLRPVIEFRLPSGAAKSTLGPQVALRVVALQGLPPHHVRIE